MEQDYEAMQHAQRALSIFCGIGDSFGSRMYSDVTSGIVAELARNQNGREECCGMMSDIAATLQKCKEMMPL